LARDETDRKANQSAVPSQVMKLLIISAHNMLQPQLRASQIGPAARLQRIRRSVIAFPVWGENQN
jgi:hypothetical protein